MDVAWQDLTQVMQALCARPVPFYPLHVGRCPSFAVLGRNRECPIFYSRVMSPTFPAAGRTWFAWYPRQRRMERIVWTGVLIILALDGLAQIRYRSC
jgi:hypothetical protein